jgi:hypothetical protein
MAALGASEDDGSSATGLLPKQGPGAAKGGAAEAPLPGAAAYSKPVLASLMIGTALEWVSGGQLGGGRAGIR